MGIREVINERRGATVIVAAALVVGAVAIIVWQLVGAGGDFDTHGTGGFFTDDDGKTWFEAGADKLPPWDHNGKPAVRCYVFTCDGGRTKFAGYLERYTAETKRMLEAPRGGGGGTGDGPVQLAAGNPLLLSMGIEVKPPLTGAWVPKSDPRAQTIIVPKCPSGSGTPELVLP
jgi:hypothetical protein